MRISATLRSVFKLSNRRCERTSTYDLYQHMPILRVASTLDELASERATLARDMIGGKIV